MHKIVDGSTQILGIVGDPICQVRAPEVWSALFRANGFNAVCVPLHVKPAELTIFLTSLRTIQNLVGLIVTIPHKLAAVHHADVLTERARRVQSVNIMRRDDDGCWRGDILDGIGFVKGLLSRGQRIDGRRALVVGSGGAGAAIAFAIAEAKAASVHVFDIAADRASDLAHRLEAAGTPSGISAASARGYDLVVNASPIGMKPDDPISIDCTDLAPQALVGDVVVHPQITPLLAAARKRGCYTQPGIVMMDNQLTAMREFFRFPDGDYSPAAAARVIAYSV
ncbi:shikimate dehydrogenase family protein [Bradyrhizobium sp. USDA 10063]